LIIEGIIFPIKALPYPYGLDHKSLAFLPNFKKNNNYNPDTSIASEIGAFNEFSEQIAIREITPAYFRPCWGKIKRIIRIPRNGEFLHLI
jgi:hypothetical protein